MEPIIIIGSGLAGYTLAREIRKANPNIVIQIITIDNGTYYSKPQLSSAFSNHKTAEALAMLTTEKIAKQLNLDVLTFHKVIKIEPTTKTIHAENIQNNSNKILPYSSLVLAQGADVIPASIKTNSSSKILSINNLQDYILFRQQCENKKNITILGAGLVGCEFANDLFNGGFKINLIALSKTPLELLLPPELGIVLQEAYSSIGINWYLENTIDQVISQEDSLIIHLLNKQKIEADLLLSAIGLRPNIQLAQNSGIKTNKGILVNQYLQTNLPDIYALGDCAEVNSLVMFYVAPLVLSAKALAKTLTHELTPVSYPPMPVILKTPACPIVTNPPPRFIEGTWQFSGNNLDKKGLFFDTENKLRGFALTGHCVNEKMDLVKQIPNYF